jgi:hypothetical protein
MTTIALDSRGRLGSPPLRALSVVTCMLAKRDPR